MLNLSQLLTFKNLIELKSYTGTARKLHMTQPGVSQHVRALEEYFGEKLIHTTGKKFEVTTKGAEVYQYAVHLFSELQTFKASLKVDDPQSGLCRMASPGGVGIGVYSELLRINKTYPKLSFEFYYAPNNSIERDLLDNKLDLGFMTVAPRSPGLQYLKVAEEKILLLVPERFKNKSFKELKDIGFITHPDGPLMLQKILEGNFPGEDFEEIKISGANNQIGRILEPVALGLGFTALPHFAYDAFREKKKVAIYPVRKKIINDIFWVKRKRALLPARFDFVMEELKTRLNWQ